MQRTQSAERIIDQLRLLLQIERVRISRKEQRQLSLSGMPLKCEEERRTEMKVFELAFARFFGYDDKTKQPGGLFLGQLRETPRVDQRVYEQSVYSDALRLHRRKKRRVTLPNYVLKTYRALFRTHRRREAKLSVVRLPPPSRTRTHLDAAA